jgi:hypothetical protein
MASSRAFIIVTTAVDVASTGAIGICKAVSSVTSLDRSALVTEHIETFIVATPVIIDELLG